LNTAFGIYFRHSAGNLHIRLRGDFNGVCAWELIKTIYRQYRGSGNIFVNTIDLQVIRPNGIQLFKHHMETALMPLSRLYIKGEKGFIVAPNGARVLISKKQVRQTKRKFKLLTI